MHSERDPIPEVPAIYFCAPTEENLGRINQDFQRGIYDIYHLNFISPISRQKLEDLASSAIQSSCVGNIHKVYDQYVNFISLEDDMFVLKHQNSDQLSYYGKLQTSFNAKLLLNFRFVAINKGDIKDSEMEMIMDSIVDSLFSVFVTLGNVPIIRSPRGNAAEMVAKKLEKKLKENLFDPRNNLFHSDMQSGNFNFQRPLLIILDRNVDMATPLHHTWSYQALAHDVLDLTLNRVMIEEKTSTGGARAKNKSYELDAKDKFWTTHKGSPFPTVAEAIQEELEEYRSSEEEVKKLKSSMGIDNETDAAVTMVTDNTARLTSAVNSLPQLLEKKRLIDMHTTVATSILNFIKSRKLDNFFELEEKIMSKTAALEKSLLDLLVDPASGTPEDKMRLFVIYFICTPFISDVDFKKYENALIEAGCNLAPISYLKRWK